MKLIDKSALVAEIKKLENESKTYPSDFDCGRLSICKELINFLDTLEVKEVDLGKEFYDFLDTFIGVDLGHLSEDGLFGIAKHFFELGMSVSNPITASDRGMANEIIFALKALGEEKMISYDKEIEWLSNKVQKI